jgi:hypothetical protein
MGKWCKTPNLAPDDHCGSRGVRAAADSVGCLGDGESGCAVGTAFCTHSAESVAEVARKAGISVTVGGDVCVAGNIRLASGATKSKKADIEFLGGFYMRYSKPTTSWEM